MIHFVAYGIPAPKGSTKAFYRPGMRFPVVTEDNAKTRPWAAIVKDAALKATGGQSIPFAEGPVLVEARFYMRRPPSLPKRIEYHVKKPDLDKLMRALKDSLTGVVWTDDSQVVMLHASKEYAQNGELPRVEVWVQESKWTPIERAVNTAIQPREYPVTEERMLF